MEHGARMTESEHQTIREIETAAHGTGQIPASTVKAWLARHESVEILGAIAAHIGLVPYTVARLRYSSGLP